jgi:hypothetical protein
MKSRMLILLIVLGCAISGAAQDKIGFLARGNLGYDVASDNLVFGGGAGYYFPLLGASTEIMADVFGGFYSQSSTAGSYRFDETGGLFYVAVHYDYMLGYNPGSTGFYALAGAGVFVGSTWWNEIQTSLLNGSTTPFEGGFSGGGPILDIGLGFVISRVLDVRVDVPVLYFIGGGFSIPIILGLIFRF